MIEKLKTIYFHNIDIYGNKPHNTNTSKYQKCFNQKFKNFSKFNEVHSFILTQEV